MSEKEKVDFRDLAKRLMFGAPSFIDFIEKNGIKYRKNKGIVDINNSLTKCTKKGMGKIEYELDMLEIYLKNVFKIYCIPQNT